MVLRAAIDHQARETICLTQAGPRQTVQASCHDGGASSTEAISFSSLKTKGKKGASP